MELKLVPPCPNHDIRSTEIWLEQMAAKGYHLCEGYAFQGGYAYFLTGEPMTVRYRIDAARKVRQSVFGIIDEALPPEEEVQQLHREMGWEFVTVRGQFLIYVCRDPPASSFLAAQRVLILVKGDVVLRANLELYNPDFSQGYTVEELATFLLENIA